MLDSVLVNIVVFEKFLNKLLLIAIYLAWAVLVYSYFFELDIPRKARLAGDISIIFLWISSIPGILKRFRVKGLLAKIEVVLMYCRRRLGVLMFMFALLHFAWFGLYSSLQEGMFPNFFDLPLKGKMGYIAIALTVPLYLTSNNFSVKFFGKLWQKIHNLVYAIMWFSALHLFFGDNLNYAIPTAVVGLLQIFSHIYNKKLRS